MIITCSGDVILQFLEEYIQHNAIIILDQESLEVEYVTHKRGKFYTALLRCSILILPRQIGLQNTTAFILYVQDRFFSNAEQLL